MVAHRDQRGGGQHVGVLAGEEQADALRVFGAQRLPHALEVRQPARRESVARRRLDIGRVECGQVVGIALDDLDTRLLGLADVASPLLVEPSEHIVEAAVGQGELEDVARLDVAEPSTSGVVALLSLIGVASGVSVVSLIAAVATIVLLFVGGAGDWFKGPSAYAGTPAPYGQPGPYGGQPDPYGQQSTYGSQPDPYGQQGSYGQDDPYGQQPPSDGSDHPPRDYPGR